MPRRRREEIRGLPPQDFRRRVDHEERLPFDQIEEGLDEGLAVRSPGGIAAGEPFQDLFPLRRAYVSPEGVEDLADLLGDRQLADRFAVGAVRAFQDDDSGLLAVGPGRAGDLV